MSKIVPNDPRTWPDKVTSEKELLDLLRAYLSISEESDKGAHGATSEWLLRCKMRDGLKNVNTP